MEAPTGASQPESGTPGHDAVDALAKSSRAGSTVDLDAATQWFLEEEPLEELTKTIELDVGRDGEHRWIPWTIKAIDRDRIRNIREQHRRGTRAQRRQGLQEVDELAVSLQIATEATVNPDLTDPEVRGKYADPADALKHRFRGRSGLIDQIAAEVLTLSGYDEDAVREVAASKN